jgi:transcriptional regulator with XRE-family HTH domain
MRGMKNTKTMFQRVQEARRDAGLDDTQASISRDLGISSAAVNKWAKQGTGMKMEHALEIAYAAGVSVDWLLTGRPPKMAHGENSSVSRLLRAFESLPGDVQEEVLRFAEFRGSID